MSLEDIVSALDDLQLAESQPAPQLPATMSDSKPKRSHSESMKSPIQWPKWSGDPADFPSFHICLEGLAEDSINDKTLCYAVFSQSLPSEAQRRVAPWMKAQNLADDWSSERLVSHLEELFDDRDATSRAQSKINKICQGPQQTFAKFRSVFEQLCSEAEHLAPIGAFKVNSMTLALAPHLQQGIAYRQGVSETNYESFVKGVQSLATELESIPSF